METGFDKVDDELPDPLFGPGSVVSLHGNFAPRITQKLVVSATEEGQVALVDGANLSDPYRFLEVAKERGLGTGFMDRIEVARGFTAYQQTSLIEDRLPSLLRSMDKASTVVLLEPGHLYLDEDVDEEEGRKLFSRAMDRVGELSRRFEAPVLALYNVDGVRDELSARVDAALVFQELGSGGGVEVQWSGGRFAFDPASHPCQSSLEMFVERFGETSRLKPRWGQKRISGFA